MAVISEFESNRGWIRKHSKIKAFEGIFQTRKFDVFYKISNKDIKKQQKIDKIRKIIRDQEIFKSVGVYRL